MSKKEEEYFKRFFIFSTKFGSLNFFQNFNIFENDMISVDIIMTIVGRKHGKVDPKISIIQ